LAVPGRELARDGAIADRGFSSTQDHGPDVDISCNALHILRDDRMGSGELDGAGDVSSGVESATRT
jgi:hypothetical protein